MSKSTHHTTPRTDVYARVTDRIIADLQAGTRPWMKPWTHSGGSGQVARPLRHNGVPYRGINTLMLWGDAMDKGFSSATWMTYQQAQEMGAQVRKGETGSLVVYANCFTRTECDDNGQDIEREIPFMKGYTVFNIEQIDGLPEKYRSEPATGANGAERIDATETFFAATGAHFHHGGGRAFYAPSLDVIQLPPLETFRDSESYAATKAHEMIHWTGSVQRLARQFGKRFGDEAYAVEELVAEMGAAFLCADLGVTPETLPDHADYLAHWLAVLKSDKRAIFTAAAQAQRAADHLHGLQERPEGQHPLP